MAVDAPWGGGKTTFLNIWSRYLHNHNFSIIEFNAWKEDFSKDPFVALCAELTGSINVKESPHLASKIDEVKEKGQVIFKHISSNLFRRMTLELVDLNGIAAALEEQATETQIGKRLVEYREAKDALEAFKRALQDMANELAGELPLVVMIDELDRCRPSYAIELLETAKHLFAVDGIVFVLAVNRAELAHAVKGLYGNSFNAEGYLRRFFDLDFRLPEPTRVKFINNLLNLTDIKNQSVQMIIEKFFNTPTLTHRDVGQAIHRLGLVLKSLPNGDEKTAQWASIVLVMRTLNRGQYPQFVHGKINDDKFAEEIFKTHSINHLQLTPEGIVVQVGIMQAYKELLGDYNMKTPLEEKLNKYVRTESNTNSNSVLPTVLRQAEGRSKEWILDCTSTRRINLK